jgi:pimeloyl-ACP methyl ester carboxylesterase
VEVRIFGRGQPLVFLHPGLGLFNADPCLALLAKHHKVIAPSHPGFGESELPDWMSTVDDVAFFYLDLMDQLDLRDVVLVGPSFGGWIAAEIAVRTTERMTGLVLADSLGIKISGPEHRDIADIYGLSGDELDRRSYCDISAKPDFKAMSHEQLRIVARNREAEALFGSTPYMHNPKLLRRLGRIRVPTLILWGAADGIVSIDYGRTFAAAIPGADFEIIEGAGHFPHIERAAEFAQRIVSFVAAPPLRRVLA